MSYICEICGKVPAMGSSQSHRRGVAGKRWAKRAPKTPRLFKPNLQKVSLKFNGVVKQMRICTKCLKRVKKFGSIKNYTNVVVV